MTGLEGKAQNADLDRDVWLVCVLSDGETRLPMLAGLPHAVWGVCVRARVCARERDLAALAALRSVWVEENTSQKEGEEGLRR